MRDLLKRIEKQLDTKPYGSVELTREDACLVTSKLRRLDVLLMAIKPIYNIVEVADGGKNKEHGRYTDGEVACEASCSTGPHSSTIWSLTWGALRAVCGSKS